MFLFTFIGIQKRILQIFITNINENSQTNYYKKQSKLFFNSMTNIKHFDPSLLSIDQIPFKGIDFFTYNIKYITNFDSENSPYLIFNDIDA